MTADLKQEDLEDMLFKLGIDSGVVEEWQRIEKSISASPMSPLENEDRTMALQLMTPVCLGLGKYVRVSAAEVSEMWFLAVAIIDKVGGTILTSPIVPNHSAMLFLLGFTSLRLSMKFLFSQDKQAELRDGKFIDEFDEFAEKFNIPGVFGFLNQMERQILQELGWRTWMPTVASWMSLFVRRYVFRPENIDFDFHPLLKYCNGFAHGLLMQDEKPCNLPPQLLAIGVLAGVLAQSGQGTVPVHAFQELLIQMSGISGVDPVSIKNAMFAVCIEKARASPTNNVHVAQV